MWQDLVSRGGGGNCKKCSVLPKKFFYFFLPQEHVLEAPFSAPGILQYYSLQHPLQHLNGQWSPIQVLTVWPKLLIFSDLNGTGVSNLVIAKTLIKSWKGHNIPPSSLHCTITYTLWKQLRKRSKTRNKTQLLLCSC